jgi:transposase
VRLWRHRWLSAATQLAEAEAAGVSDTQLSDRITSVLCDRSRPGTPNFFSTQHTSWLNQIECWFSILMRRLLKRSSFTSTQDLSAQILAFIEYFNRTLAKPFEWKYEGYSEAV